MVQQFRWSNWDWVVQMVLLHALCKVNPKAMGLTECKDLCQFLFFILFSWSTHQVSWGKKNESGVFQQTKRLHKQALWFSKCPPFAEEIFWLVMCPPTTLWKSVQVFMHLLTVIEKHRRQTWRSTPSGINWLRLRHPSVISELIEKRNISWQWTPRWWRWQGGFSYQGKCHDLLLGICLNTARNTNSMKLSAEAAAAASSS
jgi:hypothetical protein